MSFAAIICRASGAVIGLSLGLLAIPAVAAGSGRADLNAIARCAVSKDRQALTHAVRVLPLNDSAARIDAASLGDAASCVSNGAFEGPAMLLRGAAAQALYFVDFRYVGIEPHTPARNFADLGWPPIGENDPVSDPGVALFKLGDCIARNQPENVDRLMKVSYGSDVAKKLIALMQPYYAACAPKGGQISANRDALHAAIAQGAYYASVRYWRGSLGLSQKNDLTQ